MVANNCPVCGKRGKSVGTSTVKSLISISLRTVVEPGRYSFCDNQMCVVVYYHDDGHHFDVHQVRVPVYQKHHHSDEVLVCYCFQHSVQAISRAKQDGTLDLIIEDIKQGIKAGQCACDWRNPQGDCCLGNVIQIGKI